MNKKSILIIGSSGQLGSEIRDISSSYNYNFIFTDKDKLDITNREYLEKFINKNSINYIINTSAYTAVDRAEDEKELADLINNSGVQNLVTICKKYNIFLIHISTDYIFDGKNHLPYIEEDIPNPLSVYGKTKLLGEKAIINSKINAIIIRTSWLYSSYGNNFLKTIIKVAREKNSLNVVFDQIGTPTYAKDLSKVILDIIPQLKEGIHLYHYSNEGVSSWYDFAKAIIDLKEFNCKIEPIESKDYPTKAQRPYYSVLNKKKIKNNFNIKIPYWRDSLKECINKIGDNI